MNKKLLICLVIFSTLFTSIAKAQNDSKKTGLPLAQLQQQFVDLRFGMFIHFNIPTYMDQDWPDPDASPSIFNPAKLNCDQWAQAAK
ncbi:MAG: carbohydrate-binding protein, partial [Bacteroidota bacterium]